MNTGLESTVETAFKAPSGPHRRPKLSLKTEEWAHRRLRLRNEQFTPPLGITLSQVKEETVPLPPHSECLPNKAKNSESFRDIFSSPVWESSPSAEITVSSSSYGRQLSPEAHASITQFSLTSQQYPPFTTLLQSSLVELNRVLIFIYAVLEIVIDAINPGPAHRFGSDRKKSTLLYLGYWTVLIWLFLGVLNARQDWLDVNGISVVQGVRLVRGRRAAINGSGWEWSVWESVKQVLC